jgi:hypothetical protein
MVIAIRKRAMRCLLAIAMACVGVVLSEGLAFAQSEEAAALPESEPKAAPQVIPPRALRTQVDYPAGAHGDARVLLELVVLPDGSVEGASVVWGEAPFAEAARTASNEWLFEPARRDGVAVTAKIRFEVRYSENKVEPASQGSTTPISAPPQTGPEAPSGVIEVTVQGDVPPGVSSYSRAEAREVPGSFGDPTRVLEVIPGVTPVVSGMPLFFIRGAPPGNVGFFIDGIRVPLLYHALLGPSVLQPALIEKVDLYPGAYPARYGRFAGAIVDMSLAPIDDEFHAEAEVRLYDTGAFVSTPFADGRGRVMAGGRYSYTGLILSLLTQANLEYWDYNSLVSYDLNRHDTVSGFAFGSYERFKDAGSSQSFGTEFHRVDLRYDRKLSSKGTLRLALTVGSDRTRARGDESASESIVDSESIGVRSEVRKQLSDTLLWRFGTDFQAEHFDMKVNPLSNESDDVRRLFPPRTDYVAGAYTDFVWDPLPWISVTRGVRADIYHSGSASVVGFDPRISARFKITPDVSVIHTFGVAHQAPNYVPNVPALAVAGLPGGLQESIQSSAGVELKLPEHITGSATVFQNAYFKLSDPFGLSQSFALDADVAEQRSIASARGLELQLKRPLTKRLGGLIAYTLSRTTRSYGAVESVSAYDRPHVLNVAVAYDLGKRWRFGTKGVFYSGVPGSRAVTGARVFDRERGRPFYRIDLRIEKRFRLADRGWWGPVFELMNASFSSEVIRKQCGDEGCDETTVGPIPLPSLGVEAQY